MDLTDINQIKKICKQHNIRPVESRGQNFLVNKQILDRIVNASDLKKDDTVLEVGSGFGTLTIELAKIVKKVIAVDIDKKLVQILRTNISAYKNVEVIEGNVLELSSSKKVGLPSNYKVVSNLPYNITSNFLRKFLSDTYKPKEMVLMVQKEVAERICAKPGDMSLLSVSVQFFSQPEISFYVSKEHFWPQPKVDSAVIKLSQISDIRYKISEKEFFRIVKIGFSARRKQLQNNISAGFKISNEKVREILTKLGFDPKIRAQDLSLGDWIRLTKNLNR